ncbi:MAG: hypothetical protein ACKOAH_03755, partial [Pirellula sp.]
MDILPISYAAVAVKNPLKEFLFKGMFFDLLFVNRDPKSWKFVWSHCAGGFIEPITLLDDVGSP